MDKAFTSHYAHQVPRRVVVYLVDNGTSGPIARATKIAQELKNAGANVTILTPQNFMDSKLLPKDIERVPYIAERIWRPSVLNPQWQIAKMRPDILLIDEYPFVAKEHARTWSSVITVAKHINRDCQIHSMSCDIPIYYRDVEGPNLEGRVKNMANIWVTGDPSVTDITIFVNEIAKPSVLPKINYAGFMDRPVPESSRVSFASKKKEIVIYLGGMNLAKLESRYLSLLANLPLLSEEMQDAQWRFIMPEDNNMASSGKISRLIDCLPATLRGHVSLETADTYFKDKLASAAMIITGGGQSAIESVMVHQKPTVIMPGFFGEQYARAKDFANRFPEWVAATDVPTLKTAPITINRLRYNKINGIQQEDWTVKILEWAKTDSECKEMRGTLEHVFKANEKAYPGPQIMLDGARRIANAIIDKREGRPGIGRSGVGDNSKVFIPDKK